MQQQQPSIEIKRSTEHLTAKQITDRVTNMVKTLSVDMSLTTSWHEPSNSVLFESTEGLAKGTTGYLQLCSGYINLAVRLPMLLHVQKNSIEKEINQVLDDNLK